MRIFVYFLNKRESVQRIRFPHDAIVLHVEDRGKGLRLYVLESGDSEHLQHEFTLLRAPCDLPSDGLDYLASVRGDGESPTIHLFKRAIFDGQGTSCDENCVG